MTRRLSARLASLLGPRIGSTEEGVINLFDPDRTIRDRAVSPSGPLEMAQDCLYGNDGVSTGVTTYIQAFAQIGAIPASDADGGFISLSPAPKNWLLNTARINFHTADPPTSGNLLASATANVTMSADARTLIWTSAATPSGTVAGFTNVKYGQGESNAYSTSNVIPAGALAALPSLVMAGKGIEPGCLTDFGDGTLDTDALVPDLSGGRLLIAVNGLQVGLRWESYESGYNNTRRLGFDQDSFDYNGGVHPRSWARIADTTTASGTIGAIQAVNLETATDANMLYIESDNAPSTKFFGLYQGGIHGSLALRYPAASHGLSNADIGSKWARDSRTFTAAYLPNTGQVTFAVPISGTADSWALDSLSPGDAGTFTHISGAVHTGDITVSGAPTQVQLYPAMQNVRRTLLVEGSRLVSANGVYISRLLRIHLDYELPNIFEMYDALWAHAGTDTPFYPNDPDIPSAARIHIEYIFNGFGWQTTAYEIEALQDMFRNFAWADQSQVLTRRPASSESVWKVIPGTLSLQSGVSQSGGSAKDFSDWLDVSSDLPGEYYFPAAAWKAAAFWADNVQRPPRMVADQVRSSGGTALRTMITINSAVEGRTATNNYAAQTPFISAARKTYMTADYERAVTAGDRQLVVNGKGLMDPTIDTSATLYGVIDLPDGSKELHWWRRSGNLTAHVIGLRSDMVGMAAEEVFRSASVTLSIDGDEATITTVGEAYVCLHFRPA